MAEKKAWLNNTVFGASVTSFLSDFGHESVTALLPSFLASIGAGPWVLGLIEGLSDGLSSFAKLFSGFYGQKSGKRKQIAIAGYLATAIFPAIAAIAVSWPIVLVAKSFAWLGRGIRGPPRDAILAKAVEKKDLGKAFGFERTGDTLGAVAGPALAFLLLSAIGMREIFWLAVIPSLLAAIVFWKFVKDKNPKPARNTKGIAASLKELPSGFKRFLVAVLVFGISDFSHTLLILFAVAQLTPSLGFAAATAMGVLLYTLHNIVYAAACYPFGSLGDRFGRRKLLIAGYGLAVLTFIGFIVAPPSIIAYAILFSLAGIYVASEDTLERALGGEMVVQSKRTLGYGALATMNGVGDFVSSLVVGILWSAIGFSAGFAYAAIVGGIGTVALFVTSKYRD